MLEKMKRRMSRRVRRRRLQRSGGLRNLVWKKVQKNISRDEKHLQLHIK